MSTNHRAWMKAAGFSLALVVASGCATARAVSAPGPPLQVPPAPPRLLVLSDEPPPPSEAPTLPSPVVATPSSPPPVVRAPNPDPKPVQTVVAPGAPADPRTFGRPGDASRGKAINDRIGVASRTLALVNVARLSAADRVEYEQAHRFIQQAKQAVRERNLVFAATLADKAASLAAGLAN
jgi:hypothetical protein